MVETILTQCQWAQLLPDATSQVGFISALTIANLALLARSVRRQVNPKGREPVLATDPLEVWNAGNVSIALWLLCLVIIRMGA